MMRDKLANLALEGIINAAHEGNYDENALLTANAILAALPSMVVPLVWRKNNGTTWYAESTLGTYSYWEGHFRPPGVVGGTPSPNPPEAANAHHARMICAAFGIAEGGE